VVFLLSVCQLTRINAWLFQKKQLKGSYKSALIMETFAEFFKYGEPAKKLPELEVKMPVGALALAVTAVIFICLIINSSSVQVHSLGRARSYFISRRLSRTQG